MRKIILFIFLSLSLFANIDEQIEAIQKAPVSKRFMLMNAFKKKIVKMREKERIRAMSKLKSIMRSKHADKVFKELRAGKKVKKEVKNIIRYSAESEVEDQVERENEEQIENETQDHEEDDDD